MARTTRVMIYTGGEQALILVWRHAKELSFDRYTQIYKYLHLWQRSGKESACQCRRHKRHGFDPWVGKILWRRKWQPALVFLPRKFHGQRSLLGYSAWGSQRVGRG